MGTTAILLLIGALLGAISGTQVGAFAGAVLGMTIGASIYGIGWLWAHTGNAPVIERHRLLCTTRGTFADVELSGDLKRGRWLGVKRCSLEGGPPRCDATCVRLIGACQKPGAACHCGDSADDDT